MTAKVLYDSPMKGCGIDRKFMNGVGPLLQLVGSCLCWPACFLLLLALVHVVSRIFNVCTVPGETSVRTTVLCACVRYLVHTYIHPLYACALRHLLMGRLDHLLLSTGCYPRKANAN